MTTQTFFITGTDTHVGKTYITVGLLKKFNQLGFSTIGLKPIASGCELLDGQLRNDDALALQQAAAIKLSYEQINPFAFERAIAPHLAAQHNDEALTKEKIIAAINPVLLQSADICLIEGVGGWAVPLNSHELMSDVVKELNVPVILVVGMRLGCLNHAILTVKAIQAAGLQLAGWVANCIDPDMDELTANINTLQQWIKEPYWGTVPFNAKPEDYLSRYFIC